MPASDDPNCMPRSEAGSHGADTLGYLCDIILELKHLADKGGHRTLSAILAAALTEARIQNDQRRSP